MSNKLENAVKSQVTRELERIFHNDLLGIVDKATKYALDKVRDNLRIKLVAQSDNTFSIDFYWVDQSGVEREK